MVRQRVVDELVPLNSRSAALETSRLLADGNPSVKKFAAYAVARLGDGGVKQILKGMSAEENRYWRRLGTQGLDALRRR